MTMLVRLLPWNWSYREWPEHVEVVLAIFAGILAIASVLSDPSHKVPFTVSSGLFALLIWPVKLWAKKVERDHKAETDDAAKKVLEEMQERAANASRSVVSAILENMRAELFCKRHLPAWNNHRATLFQCKEEREGEVVRKFLCIHARSGSFQNSTVRWYVTDDHQDLCKGLAGKVWYQSCFMQLDAGCDWPAESDGDQNMKLAYCKGLGLTTAEAEALNIKSRSFMGQVVLVNGRKWGVLLTDSVDEMPGSEKATYKKLKNGLHLYAVMIGKVVEELSL